MLGQKQVVLFLSIVGLVLSFYVPAYAAGEEGRITLDERMGRLEERMTRVEERMIRLEERMSRIEVMVEERFKAIEQRFDDMNTRFNYVYMMLAALIALIGLPAVSRARQGSPVDKRQEQGQEDEVKASIESMKRKKARLEDDIRLLKEEVELLKPQTA